jgi:hypothetical protein
MVGNLAVTRLARSRWTVAVNLQIEPAACYVGVVWHAVTERVPIALAPDPKLAPPAISVHKFDLWIHPLPVIGLHLVVWRVG